jgi:hypothetical protein
MSFPFALMALGAFSSADAVDHARRVLAGAPRCSCCPSHRAHVAKYVGSTLFVDDDPHELSQAVPTSERTPWTERLIAACIVLHGRAREARS